jgi:hypothetical protein
LAWVPLKKEMFLACHAGGVSGIYVGAPLDTIKVLMQSRPGQYKGEPESRYPGVF